MKLIPNQESKYGKFDLIPDKGKQLRHIVDFESGLLIVYESPIDLSEIPYQHGGRIIPTKTFIVDQKQQRILQYQEWRKYFNYFPIETFSEDGKLKEVWTRKHERERQIDYYEGYLLEVETGKKLIDKASSVAFDDKKRRSLIERYYQSIEQRKKYLKSLEKGVYPEDKYKFYLNDLKDDELIIQYLDEIYVYELKHDSGLFKLRRGGRPFNRKGWENLKLTDKIEDFDSIDAFWESFSKDEKWFIQYYLRKNNRAIEKHIIGSHNQLIDSGEISYHEHEKLNDWMNKCFNREIDRNVYWQFCSNCRERVFYYPRYPKYACRNCVNLITDEFGNKIDYKETHELQGDKIRLKSNQKEVKIFINNNEYWAIEARFGGIVYQKKEKS